MHAQMPIECATVERSIFNNYPAHAQRERGKVIDLGVHIYVCSQKNI